MVKFVNLTPHVINFYSPSAKYLLFAINPSGKVARVDSKPIRVLHINNIPINKVRYGDVTVDGQQFSDFIFSNASGSHTIFIVSSAVLQALKTKGFNLSTKSFTIVSPDTNQYSVVRDYEGHIVGVRAFQIL